MRGFDDHTVLIRLKVELVSCDTMELTFLRGAPKGFESRRMNALFFSDNQIIVAYVTINTRCIWLLNAVEFVHTKPRFFTFSVCENWKVREYFSFVHAVMVACLTMMRALQPRSAQQRREIFKRAHAISSAALQRLAAVVVYCSSGSYCLRSLKLAAVAGSCYPYRPCIGICLSSA